MANSEFSPGAAIAGVASLGQMVTGLLQRGKANRMAKKLVRPTEQVQDEYFQNVNLAKNMAQTGLPSQVYNNNLNNLNRNLGAATRLLQSRANPLAGVNNLLRSQNDAVLNLDAQDANARMNNQRNLMQQNAILGAQKRAAFDWNQKGAYGEKLAEIQALRGSGMQNMAGGFNTAATLGMMMTEGQESGGNTLGNNPDSFNPNWFQRNFQQGKVRNALGGWMYGKNNVGLGQQLTDLKGISKF